MAAVVLDVPAARVYAKAVQLARANPAVRVVSEDAAQRRLVIAEGNDQVTLGVQDLSGKVSQVTVLGPGEPDMATSRTVEAVLRVCKEMK